ncbi:PKD domain-containing protein, partial [uncultured Cellulomonas sp.]|uniref:PKD domain-containing protein n=1 Tax=uncultured Cellulomonas sp. TaxID=189682 RepID=UPI00260DD232
MSTALRRPIGRLTSRAAVATALAGGLVAGLVGTAHAADAAPVSASDAFGRTVSSGWGSAEQGGTWTSSVNAAVRQSVSGGAGKHTVLKPGHLGTALLAGTATTDADVRVDVVLDKVADGGGLYASVIGRNVGTSGDYRARLKVQASGAVTLMASRANTTLKSATLTGLRYTAGTKLSVRLQVTGTSPTTIRAKAWKAGTPEPAAWLVTTTDTTVALQKAGTVGASTYVSASARNLPVAVGYDDLAVRPTVAPPAPNAAPTARAASAVSDLAARLDGSASTDVDGTIRTYAWSFGDGSTGTGASATHSYATAGTYTVRLTVTDDDGATGTTTVPVTVSAPNVAPVATVASSATDLTARLDGTASTDPDGKVVSHLWSFGDGSTGTGATTTHTYAKAGSYTVSLTVTDDDGATSTTRSTVAVTAPVALVPAPVSSVVPGSVAGPETTGVPAGKRLTVHDGDLTI